MRAEFIEDDSDDTSTIDISNSADWFSFKKEAEHEDPFNIGLDEIKKLNGLGATFRRKVNRDFSKAFVGTSGVGTQQNLMQQAISGYALFDLVEPTYNLEYLSKIYENTTMQQLMQRFQILLVLDMHLQRPQKQKMPWMLSLIKSNLIEHVQR